MVAVLPEPLVPTTEIVCDVALSDKSVHFAFFRSTDFRTDVAFCVQPILRMAIGVCANEAFPPTGSVGL